MHGDDFGAFAPADNIRPVVGIMNIIQLFGCPGKEQFFRRIVMAVFLHPGNGDINVPAVLYERKKLLIQIFRIAPEEVVRIRADDGVKEFFREGESRCVGVNGDDLLCR
ncbi:hypothetical protein SDC9_205031 [bioreactor metagenome]|uniref:Uncharacterized protein n=1 Tax=bioreactor metagenome TaxID=1076179 RepID=A0A645J1Q9_9ZZZZ